MKKTYVLIIFCLCVCEIFAQNYAVSLIPDSLKLGAQAVVREQKEFFVQKDERNGTYKCMRVITIFNEKGLKHAKFIVGTDDFEELKSFLGEVFDANGKSIKKIKQKDLQSLQYSASYELVKNAKATYYEYFSPVFPFTVKYEWELKLKDGILYYPSFDPILDYDVALEKAEYTLQVPDAQVVRYKNSATDISPAINGNTYIWSAENMKMIEYERFAPSNAVFPIVYLAPENFCVQTACGNMKTWENYGYWVQDLQKGRDVLPENIKAKVAELTQNISDKREKVRVLYDFMQKTTHYVSIQLGVGGWQPIAAADVAKTGFGDCKALSNYMKALLATVEIPSFYTVISTNKKRFFSDFPSFGQANHVILTVPLDTDTVYLECTSQLAPFGFISDLAGHDCLLVGDNEVRFFTIPAYKKYENLISNSLKISLNESGTANLQVHTSLRNEDFEQIYYTLKAADETEKNKALAGLLRVQKPKISNFSKEEKLDERPQIDLKFDVTCEDFASLTGQRMVLKINPFRVSFRNFLTGNKRKFDIDISNSHIQTDSIVIDIPAGYAVEIKPKSTIVSTKYGSFITTATFTDTQVTYVQMLTFNQGKYSASEFDEIKKFCVQLDNLQNSDIGFKKSEK